MENNKNQELANQAYELFKNEQLTVENLEKLLPFKKIDIVDFTKAFLDNIRKEHEISTIANRDILIAMIKHLNKMGDIGNATPEERKQIIEHLEKCIKHIYELQKDKNNKDYKLNLTKTIVYGICIIAGIITAPKLLTAFGGVFKA